MTLITAEALAQQIDNPQLVILDASMPPIGIALETVAMPCYIPGARRFDIEEFSDSSSGLPHTLLPPETFAEKARELAINQDSHIVVYDYVGVYSSPRAWWNFKLMGFDNIEVLDGGLKAWLQAGYKTTDQLTQTNQPGNFQAHLQLQCLKDMKAMYAAMGNSKIKIIDVRGRGRFNGTQPEPRPGLKSGHIPGAINIPFTDFYQGAYLKPKDELVRLFTQPDTHIQPDDPMVFSCGSGVTACIGLLAAAHCGYHQLSLYDGAWAEWGSGGHPIATEGDE